MPCSVSMIDNKLTSDLLRGHTDTMILKLLSDGDKYGYEIAKLIQERSDNEYELKEATMYSSLKRLENVSFHYSDIRKTNFDGAIMDKVTYALLQGLKANLSTITIK